MAIETTQSEPRSRPTFWRRQSAAVRLAVTTSAIILAATAPVTWGRLVEGWPITWVHVASVATASQLLWSERIPLKTLLVQGAVVLFPLVFFGAAIPFTHPTNGVAVLAGVVAKAFASWLWIALLINTTRADEMLRALSRWRVPSLFLATLIAMHQYLEVMIDESRKMRCARLARTFDDTGRFSFRKWRANANILGVLFLRATDRAERLHRAMLARGYDGEIRFF